MDRPKRKLTLHRETLVPLQTNELDAVHGGDVSEGFSVSGSQGNSISYSTVSFSFGRSVSWSIPRAR